MLQSLGETKDASGGTVSAWTDWKSVRADVIPLSGTERNVSSQGGQVAEARTEILIRYRAGVDTTMRVLYAGKVYNIRHVKDIGEDHDTMVLTCDTGVSDG